MITLCLFGFVGAVVKKIGLCAGFLHDAHSPSVHYWIFFVALLGIENRLIKLNTVGSIHSKMRGVGKGSETEKEWSP